MESAWCGAGDRQDPLGGVPWTARFHQAAARSILHASRLPWPTSGIEAMPTFRDDRVSRMVNRVMRHERNRDADPQSVPLPIHDQTDLVLVDTTWGEIQPLQPFPDV